MSIRFKLVKIIKNYHLLLLYCTPFLIYWKLHLCIDFLFVLNRCKCQISFKRSIQANDWFTNNKITLQLYVSIAIYERLLIMYFDKWPAYSILTPKVTLKGLKRDQVILNWFRNYKKTCIFPYVNNLRIPKSTYAIQPQFCSSIKRGGGSSEAFLSFRFRGIHTTTCVR